MVLTDVPPGLLSGLPEQDQAALTTMRGQLVLLVGYDEDGRAELEFNDHEGSTHTIWVNPSFIEPRTRAEP